jgi:hypothetical protein
MKKNFENNLYLHIGVPKTGTSALQVFFAKNRKILFKYGIRYPLNFQSKVGELELISSGNGAKIALCAFLNNLESNNVLKIFSQFLENKKSILLSSEYFCSWDKDRFLKLKELANSYNFNTKIIVYLREQADLIVAHYFQLIKRRPKYKLEDFNIFAQNYIVQHGFLNYFSFLNTLEKIFGSENIIVNSTKKEMLFKGNLILDFMNRVFSIKELSEFSNVGKINPTPTQQELYIKYILNKFDPSLSFSDTYLKIISLMHENRVNINYDEDNFFIDKSTIDKIRENFAESNKNLCLKWFSGKNPEDVFEIKRYRDKMSYSKETFDINIIVEIFGGFIIELWKKFEYLEKELKK